MYFLSVERGGKNNGKGESGGPGFQVILKPGLSALLSRFFSDQIHVFKCFQVVVFGEIEA